MILLIWINKLKYIGHSTLKRVRNKRMYFIHYWLHFFTCYINILYSRTTCFSLHNGSFDLGCFCDVYKLTRSLKSQTENVWFSLFLQCTCHKFCLPPCHNWTGVFVPPENVTIKLVCLSLQKNPPSPPNIFVEMTNIDECYGVIKIKLINLWRLYIPHFANL